MLGVWLAPDGNKIKLISELKNDTIEWSTKAVLGHPSQSESWAALHTTISSKVKYLLPASTFSKEECKSIMWPVLQGGLPKCGICPKMATDIRDGPTTSGGAGMLSSFHYQGTICTAMIVEHCHKNSTTGNFLLICIEDLVVEVEMYNSL